MNKDAIYRAWAPHTSIWSRWVKPVLFSRMDVLTHETLAPPSDALDAPWLGRAENGHGLVIDLPGPLGIDVGLFAAKLGFRPIPLYNGIPGPTPPTPGMRAVIDTHPIMRALAAGVPQLEQLRIPDHAPPAFLLDSDRAGRGLLVAPGMFDNRSISLPADFPSAQFLINQGIRRILVVIPTRAAPSEDLSRTLHAWQHAGIELTAKSIADTAPPESFRVAKPFFLLPLWHALVANLGYKRKGEGFGGMVPYPSSG